MNRSFRLIWNDQKHTYVVAPETARGRGKRSNGRAAATVSALAASLLSLAAWGAPNTLPSGGQVSAGQASIASSGNVMTVTQGTQRAAINWPSFSIGSDAAVNFQQPNAAAVILNRVVGSEQSVIDGALNANGQVFLLNANGLLFGKGASVNTAGLVASTLSLSDADFMAGKSSFTANGSQASVINLGTINAADGGYVALLGQQVSNQGAITARLGTVALAAGDKISLNFNGNSLLGVVVDQGALNALVENRQAILADGGLVVLTAKGLDAVLASAVNNSGEVRAQTVANQAGRILLLGDMQSGSVNVGGTLDASAPAGGNGGFVETSAAHVKVAADTRVTTAAAQGQAGNWLIDPHDFTIAASGGDISGTTLSNNLASGNITIQSSGGAAGTNGDLNVNDAVAWSAHTLTLTAANNVNINAVMSATGAASLALNPASANGSDAANASGTVRVGMDSNGFIGRVDFSGEGTLAIGGINYTVINSLGVAGSSNGSDLQGMNGNLSGHYVLGSNIDATSTSGWNGGAGFVPVGNGSTAFSGIFDGLGHTISGLNINRLGTDQVGLFGVGDSSAVVRNVGLAGASVSGKNFVGALMGSNHGSVANSYADAAILANVASVSYIGGLVGLNDGSIAGSHVGGSVRAEATYDVRVGGLVGGNIGQGSISGSHSTAAVTINNNGVATPDAPTLGGLAGINDGSITNSYATGAVTNGNGGLVGLNNGSISASHASGSVSGGSNLGGLVGLNTGSIADSYAETGAITGLDNIGGLVGLSTSTGSIARSHANGNVSASRWMVGGLVGVNQGSISDSQADIGTVSSSDWFGHSMAGGLVGYNSGSITGSQATGNVSGPSAEVGGLVGKSEGTGASISNSHASGAVAGGGNTGGLVGFNTGAISVSDASGTVTSGGDNIGGLVGYNESGASIAASHSTGNATGHTGVGGLAGVNRGSVSDSSATGSVSAGEFWGGSSAGGLVGYNTGDISNSSAAGAVTATGSNVGGLVGAADAGSVTNSHATGAAAGVSNVGGLIGLSRVAISGSDATGAISGLGDNIGGLVGDNEGGSIGASHSSGNVTGHTGVGGLAGVNRGAISDSQATGSVTAGEFWGGSSAGGLVGWNNGAISHSSAGGAVTAAGANVGGLIGVNDGGSISASHASGAVAGTDSVGGLIGYNNLTITGSDASGAVSASGSNVGGLVGNNDGSGSISASHASGNVTGFTTVGGLVGVNRGGISDSQADTGTVSAGNFWGGSTAGGLVGYNTGAISNSSAGGVVTATGSGVGGLVGTIDVGGSVSNSHAGGPVSGTSDVGGLVGYNRASISGSDASGAVTGSGDNVGGLLGTNNGGTVSASHASGAVVGSSNIGGLVGYNNATVSASDASGAVSASGSNVGGLVGNNDAGGSISTGHSTGNITGFTSVGGLAGVNRGSISDSQADTGTVSAGNFWGGSSAGGLVGYNTGTISGSTAAVAVTATGSGVGGLVGTADAGNISSSHATGAVAGTDNVGGLVGYSRAAISGSDAIGNVSGSGSNVGGLVGNNDSGGSISTSYADIGVVAGNSNVGGLVGNNAGNVANSHASGAVTSNGDNVGGLVGNNNSGISTSYATGAASGRNAVGGLVGLNNSAALSDDYASGTVTGVTNVGGLVGYNNHGTLSNSFYDVDQVDINGGKLLTAGGIYDAQFQDWIGHGRTLNIADYAANLSHDSESGTYGVSSAAGLRDMLGFAESNNAGLTFRLKNSIDLAQTPELWVPYFAASFDGGSKVIANASIQAQNINDQVGFFGQQLGSVSNLGLPNISVAGHSRTGGLAGYNQGSISNSYVEGSVSGTDVTGGLVGENQGSISNSYAAAQVAGNVFVGGLAGANTGTIDKTYATGQVNGNAVVAGLVGSNEGVVNASFWDNAGGSLSTADARLQANYTSATAANGNANPGWDFNNTWVIYDGHSHPLLRSFMTPLTITANNALKTYDGQAYDGSAGLSYSDTPDQSKLLGAVAYEGTRNAGSYTITPNGLYSNQQGYLISYGSGTLQVDQAVLSVSANGSASGKVYDGNTVTSVSLASNAVVGDQLTLNYAGANFANANAGSGKTINVTGISISGEDAANYTLHSTAATTTADISPKPVSVAALDGASKVYDGSTAASSGLFAVTNGVSGDTITLSGSATLSAKDVGTRSFELTGLGLDNGNYTIVGGTASGNVAVTARPVSVTAQNGVSKVYDGNTVTSVSLASNGVSGDQLTLNYAGANFANANAGSGKTINVTGISVTGADAANYTLQNTAATTTADISPKPVAVASLDGAAKVYDGSTAASSGLFTVTNVVVGDALHLSGDATLAAKDVGARSFALAGLALDNSNYTLVGGSASGNVAVTPRAVTYVLTLADPAQSFTATGLDLYTATTIGSVLQAAVNGLPAGGSSVSLGYSLWKDGAQVSAVKDAGSYEVRAGFNPANPDYRIVDANSTVLRFTVGNPASLNSVTAVAVVQQPTQQPAAFSPVNTAGSRSFGSGGNAMVNVVNLPSSITDTFGSGTRLALVSSPSANEPTQTVTLSEARGLIGGGSGSGSGSSASGGTPGAGSGEGSREVRVPVSRNSLAEIVNGGVKLPSGVEQQLFIVKE
ncbi:MAG: GLUG motif-containing protein [Leptothrix sp. (in: b-proteobacteria)]